MKNKYTVTFNSSDGTNIGNQIVVEGNKAVRPVNPVKEGYTFGAWTLNGSVFNFNTAINGNITLVATWNQKSYTVKVSAVDDYSPARILTVYENGTQITVNNICYSDGSSCFGTNVNKNAIAGETSFMVILSGGTKVTATVN